MKVLYFCLLSLIFSSCLESNEGLKNSVNNIEIHYNDDSTRVLSFGSVNKNKKDGEWYFFDQSGKVQKIQTFKNGVLNGPVTEFLCCQKFSTYTYKNGKLEGEVIYYSSDGNISSKGYFIAGKLNGIWIDFYNNELLSVSIFNNDIKEVIYENIKLKDVIIGNEFFGCCK
ncbi:toxin-antitoxin system YwqK family antitoxin [Peijinzhouia sedimentorum]